MNSLQIYKVVVDVFSEPTKKTPSSYKRFYPHTMKRLVVPMKIYERSTLEISLVRRVNKSHSSQVTFWILDYRVVTLDCWVALWTTGFLSGF